MQQGTMPVEEYTPEQEAALDELVRAFGVKHSKRFTVELKVYDGKWTEAAVNPSRVLQRGSNSRRRT